MAKDNWQTPKDLSAVSQYRQAYNRLYDFLEETNVGTQ